MASKKLNRPKLFLTAFNPCSYRIIQRTRNSLKCLRSRWSSDKRRRSGTTEISRVKGDPNLARLNFSESGLKTYDRFPRRGRGGKVRSLSSRGTHSHTRSGIARQKRGIFTLRFSHLIHIKVARKQEGSIVTSTMIGHSRSLSISTLPQPLTLTSSLFFTNL